MANYLSIFSSYFDIIHTNSTLACTKLAVRVDLNIHRCNTITKEMM